MKDELVEEIDRVALAQGQSRSAWIARVLTQSALSEGEHAPLVPMSRRGRPDEYVRVTLRLHRHELEAIDAVGAPLRLGRNEWIKRAIRWQLWDRAGVLRLAPATAAEIGKLRKQVLAIGRNINQAVHAMNAANMPGSSLDIARIAEPFIDTCAELKSQLFALRRALSRYVSGEVAYWTGAAEEQET
ncbi:hypothetical protein [Sphingomonas kyungheensis]|uniref:Bacterial mobilisation domain-containing protein n=1 Tax=Sphingomonas kyungheensis TaxID=1069987 RepID=A0ABU8H467_9SPHN